MLPKVIGTEDIRLVLTFERLIPAIRQGFRDYYLGRTKVVPLTNIDLPEANGEMHIKPGYMVDGAYICVKIVTCFYDNPQRGLPTRDGVLILANKQTGKIEAVLCDSGLITDMRTAGSSAVAVDAMAREGALTLGLVGAGTQAFWHVEAIRHVRSIEKVVIWGRNRERSEAAARRIFEATGIPAELGTLAAAAACNVVVCATPAAEPILVREMLQPGTVVVAMGADNVGKRELGPEIVRRADLIVADSLEQCRQYGELQWLGPEAAKPRIVELGALLAGKAQGRISSDDIVIYDSTGVAFQDVVGAAEVLRHTGEMSHA